MTRISKRTNKLLRQLSTVKVFLIGFLLLVPFFAGCKSNEAPSNAPVVSAPPAGTTYPMPPVNGKSLTQMGWNLGNGKHGIFGDFKGQVLVLDFYATWCEPCRNSIPHLVQLQQKYEKQGLRVVGLNVGGPDDLDKIPGFAQEFKIQYQLGVPDDDLDDFLLSDRSDIPQTFIFDRHGTLTKRFVGFGDSTGEAIDEAVVSALGKSSE